MSFGDPPHICITIEDLLTQITASLMDTTRIAIESSDGGQQWSCNYSGINRYGINQSGRTVYNWVESSEDKGLDNDSW